MHTEYRKWHKLLLVRNIWFMSMKLLICCSLRAVYFMLKQVAIACFASH